MNTSDQLRARLSNSSDDSPLHEDATDSEHETPPFNEDAEEVIETLDPRNSQLSLHSGAGNSFNDLRHPKRRADYDRLSLSHRVKYLVEDTKEAKKLRQVLHAALDRLDSETQRAKEAERRALELAERFKIVNEARVATQQELDRAHSELRLYKVQLENAQKEILRGSDLLKDIEQQRDNAEASAARARSLARKLKEEQLMMKAKEEGRREGYQEGLRRGYQQARGMSLIEGPLDVPPAGLGPLSTIIVGAAAGEGQSASDHGRTDALDGLSMINLSTPAPGSAPLAAAYDQDSAGVQGSRFRETMMTPSTLRSAPLPGGSQAVGPSGWPASQDEEIRYMRPMSSHNAPPSPTQITFSVESDGYFPSVGPDNVLPHQRLSAQSAAAPKANYQRGVRVSPRSVAESLPSTTISQFDLVSSPKNATRGLRERSSGLSAIPEVSSSMEFSPGTEGRVLSSIMPEPLGLTHLVPVEASRAESRGNHISRSGSQELNERMDNDASYSDPDQMEQWRRSTASQSHPSSSRERLFTPTRPTHSSTSTFGDPRNVLVTPSPRSHRRSHSAQSPPSEAYSSHLGAPSHRRTESSTPISIHIDPPSGPGSNVFSPISNHPGMLSPDNSRRELPGPPGSTPTPVRPHSAAAGHPVYSYGAPPARSQSPYRYIPSPSNDYPSRSKSSLGRPHPSERPGQMTGFSASRSNVLQSPSSHQSFSQDGSALPSRPASRTSAGDHQRTLSLHAGSTPAIFARPLSGSQQIRRIPSTGSINSETARKSGYEHYDPAEYVDPAFLASSEDLRNMASPNTMANTVANTRGSSIYAAAPSKLRSSSPAISYNSFQSR